MTPPEQEDVLAERSLAGEGALYVHALFEEQVSRTPDSIAVVFEDKEITYAELNRCCSRLAAALRTHGAGPETLVGIYLDRSIALVIGLLGTLKAGAAYVPLDPSFPSERLGLVLSDCHPAIIITTRTLADSLPVPAADRLPQLVYVEDFDSPGEGDAASVIPAPNALAYILYTSGSTGRPKGVQIEHRSLANFLLSMRQVPGLTETDILLAVTTISFDIAALEIFLPLIVGARVVMVTRETARDGFSLIDRLKESRANFMQATPATWRLLIESGWEGAPGFRILCGGEALRSDLAALLLDRADAVWNMYGPTETTIWSSVQRVRDPARIFLGDPIAETQFYVLNERLEQVATGEAGELFIGGAGLARGYFNRPDLTAQSFMPDPFSHESGARIYRSGDLVRRTVDRDLEFIGRIDNQVKIHGFRIELGDIETALLRHPGVRNCCVTVTEGIDGNKRLAAYLICGRPYPAVSDLIAHAKAILPPYMIPAAYTFLESFPLTPSGKLDRRALPAPETYRPDTIGDYVAPATPREVVFAEIWRAVLGLEQVGVHDRFEEVGGDSLSFMHIVARARRAGLLLRAGASYRQSTIAEMARQARADTETPVSQDLVTGEVTLSKWRRDFPAVEDHMFEAPDLSPEVFTQAARQIWRCHDLLRLQFAAAGSGAPDRIADDDADGHSQIIDLSQASPAEQDTAILELRQTTTRLLIQGQFPLFRVFYLKTGGERRTRLLFMIHHTLADIYSLTILIGDFASCCRQLESGAAGTCTGEVSEGKESEDKRTAVPRGPHSGAETASLPPKTTSVVEWSRTILDYVNSPDARREVRYWDNIPWRLAEKLPADLDAEIDAPRRQASVRMLTNDIFTTLRGKCAGLNLSIQSAMLAAVLWSVRERFGKNAVAVRIVKHGRDTFPDRFDLSRTVGWIAHTYPALIDLKAAASLEEALPLVERAVDEAPNNGALFEWLEDQGQLRGVEHREAVQIDFNFLGSVDADSQGYLQPVDQVPIRIQDVIDASELLAPTLLRGFEVNFALRGGNLFIIWQSDANVYHHATTEQLVQRTCDLLHAFAIAPRD
jgi:amino acid adenylation domain-containing protein